MTLARRTLPVVAALACVLTAAPSADAAKKTESDCKPLPSQARASTVPVAATPLQSLCMRQAKIGVGDVVDTGKDIVNGGIIGDLVGGAVGDVAGDVVGGVGESAMNGIASWIGKQTGGMVQSVLEKVRKSTSPSVVGPKATWFKSQYTQMMLLAAALSLIAVLAAVIGSMFRADVGMLARAVLVNWPMAFFTMGVALGVTQLALNLTDVLDAAVVKGFGTDMKTIFTSIAKTFQTGNLAEDAAYGGILTMIVGIVALLGSLLLWIELIIREAAVYIVLLFLPLGCVASIWPPAKRVARKMAMLLFVVIVSKFFILTIYAFGASMIATGRPDDVTKVLAGVVVMFLAAFSPMMLLKLLPFEEMDAVDARPGVPSVAKQQMSSMLARSTSGRMGGGGKGSSGAPGAGGPQGGGAGGPKGPGGASGGQGGGSGGGAGKSGAKGAGGAGKAAPAAGAAAGVATAGVALAAAGGKAAFDRASQATEQLPASSSLSSGNSGGSPSSGPKSSGSEPKSKTPPPHIAVRPTAGVNAKGVPSV